MPFHFVDLRLLCSLSCVFPGEFEVSSRWRLHVRTLPRGLLPVVRGGVADSRGLSHQPWRLVNGSVAWGCEQLASRFFLWACFSSPSLCPSGPHCRSFILCRPSGARFRIPWNPSQHPERRPRGRRCERVPAGAECCRVRTGRLAAGQLMSLDFSVPQSVCVSRVACPQPLSHSQGVL